MLHYFKDGFLSNLKKDYPNVDDCKFVCTRSNNLCNGSVIHFFKIQATYYVVIEHSYSSPDEVFETSDVSVGRGLFIDRLFDASRLVYQIH